MSKNWIHASFAALSVTLMLGACGVNGDEPQISREQAAEQAQRPGDLPTTKCTTYYYDAPGGNIVGYCTIACSGGARCSGSKTAYHDQDCESCLTDPPKGP